MTHATPSDFLLFAAPPGLRGAALLAFDAVEEVSRPFLAYLTLRLREPWFAAQGQAASSLGQAVSFGFRTLDGGERWFHGLLQEVAATPDPCVLRATVGSCLHCLGNHSSCRTFANLTLEEIVAQIFREQGITAYRLSLSPKNRRRFELVTQYRETTLNFLLRLFEQEGWSFYVEHERNSHRLVITDDLNGSALRLGAIPFRPDLGVERNQRTDAIHRWTFRHSLVPQTYVLNGWNWRTPRADLLARDSLLQPEGPPTRGEWYDLGVHTNWDEGQEYARIQCEAAGVGRSLYQGEGNERRLGVGTRFEFVPEGPAQASAPRRRQPPTGATYVVLAVVHYARGGADSEPPSYANHLTCLPEAVPFRPARRTPKPMIAGVIPAVVTGGRTNDDGGEIPLDADGRTPIQFCWNRPGAPSQPVWVRTVQAWAGNGFGAWFAPRRGQEVMVGFEEGDPDRPVIVGAVYRNAQSLPFPVEPSATVSGFRSHSSPDRAADNANLVAFDDAAGREELLLQAQRDLRLQAGNDLLQVIKGRHAQLVERDRHSTVNGAHVEKILKDYTLGVGAKLAIDAAHTLLLQCGQCRLQLEPTRLVLEGGGSYLELSASGIRLNGALVKLNCAGAAPHVQAVPAVTPTAPPPNSSITPAAGRPPSPPLVRD